MSSRAVRQTVRGWLRALTTPFHDSINYDIHPTETTWLTVEFASFGVTKESFCDSWSESGDIVLVFVTSGVGLGDDALLAQAEADADAFYKNVDPTGKLVLVNRSAPEDATWGDDGPWYSVVYRVGYEYRK